MSPLFERIQEYLPLLTTGLWQTVAVTLLSLVLASALGLVWALMAGSRRWIAGRSKLRNPSA